MASGVSSNVAGLLMFAAAANLMLVAAAATTQTVGGNNGWKLPSTNTDYSDWASAQTFAVGDTLGAKASYDSCNTSNQIGSTLTASPARVTLTTAGNHYYICAVPLHCSLGQKLAITVLASAPPGTVSDGGSTAATSSLPPAITCTVALLSFAFYFLL